MDVIYLLQIAKPKYSATGKYFIMNKNCFFKN